MTSPLFKPFSHGALKLPNRIVMAPMTRRMSPNGIPGNDVADYYKRRAASHVGLIVTEGTWINSNSAQNSSDVPRFYGEDAFVGWRNIVHDAHEAGGLIVPQLWHVGAQAVASTNDNIASPSGFYEPDKVLGEPLTISEIDTLIDSYATAAHDAEKLGFDGVEFHAAHGYLIDQFFWGRTNIRTDLFGGTLAERTRFGVEIIKECRRRVSRNFPLILRISQFKAGHFDEQLAKSPTQLESFLLPLCEAGIDIFHCSQRRFWEAEFQESDLNLAGWTKKLTGKPTITVGSVGLDSDGITSNYLQPGSTSEPTSLNKLEFLLDRGDFDLVAVGRALLQDPLWALKIHDQRFDELESYSIESVNRYY